jgi:hypothetical protein
LMSYFTDLDRGGVKLVRCNRIGLVL